MERTELDLSRLPDFLAYWIAVNVFVVVAWDVMSITTGWPPWTVSAVIWEWAVRYPWLKYLMALLIAHLFWR